MLSGGRCFPDKYKYRYFLLSHMCINRVLFLFILVSPNTCIRISSRLRPDLKTWMRLICLPMTYIVCSRIVLLKVYRRNSSWSKFRIEWGSSTKAFQHSHSEVTQGLIISPILVVIKYISKDHQHMVLNCVQRPVNMELSDEGGHEVWSSIHDGDVL